MLDLELYLLLPLALVLGLMAMPILSRRMQGKVNFVEPGILIKELKSPTSPYVFDIRPPKQYANGHIAGAANLPEEKLTNLANDPVSAVAKTKSEPVVIVCQSDLQSMKMWRKLHTGGWENIRVLKGGMYKWKRSSLPVEKP